MPVQTISRDELTKQIDEPTTVVLEALPLSYYEDKHLPGALNMPVDDAEELAPTLIPSKDTTVVVYCADLPCGNSDVVSRKLDGLGYSDVREYAEGKKDWIEAGLPTVSGSSPR